MPYKQRFTEADLTRALRSVTKFGLTPTKIEIDQSGRIAIYFDQQGFESEDITQYLGSNLRGKKG